MQVMAERYQRLRLEVQTGNDSGQRGRTYADLARRVVKAENKAANAAFAPLARVPAGSGAGISAAGEQPLQALAGHECMQWHMKRLESIRWQRSQVCSSLSVSVEPRRSHPICKACGSGKLSFYVGKCERQHLVFTAPQAAETALMT